MLHYIPESTFGRLRLGLPFIISVSLCLGCAFTSDTANVAEPAPAALPAPTMGLHEAVLRDDLPTIRRHIAAGSDLNAQDSYGSTPLIVATTFGKFEAAQVLIDAGADLSVRNPQGSSALHIAALFGRSDFVRALLAKGADRRLRNETGATAYDIVALPFEMDRMIYDDLARGLAPLGLKLDYARIAHARPTIAALLRATSEELEGVTFTPIAGRDWEVSSPADQGLEPELVAELYRDAGELETLDALIVVKNGQLVAEGYFNDGGIDSKQMLQSVTKSYTSAALGLALQRGCITSLDQKVIDFLPEFRDQLRDPRKSEITIRQLLQMRGGYPWEESEPALWAQLRTGQLLRPFVDFPLKEAPGTAFAYSNLSSHWLGVIVARACKTDLRSFAERELLSHLGSELGPWRQDVDGYYVGLAEMQLKARDLAKFGQLYLDEGKFAGKQLLPEQWVKDSLSAYSTDAWIGVPPQHHAGRYFRDLGYGYQFWSAKIGPREIDYAWGHGGQLILLLEDLNMVVVTMSFPFYQQSDDESWQHEREVLNVVGKFVQTLPAP